MANWLAKMLGGAPGVHLGAFGKHPGWDDHVEPIGLDSEPLVAARDILYVDGIGGVINAAMWEKKPEEVLPQIAHVFCWNGDADMLLGRMWSSTDGKGRALYPMVAVAHLGVPFSYSLAVRTARVLAEVETRCRQAATAEEVRALFAAGQEDLRAALALPPDELGAEPDRATCSRLAEAMGLNDGEKFARALYAVEGKVQAFSHSTRALSGKISLKMLESDAPAQQSRLPMPASDSIDGIAFWQKVVTEFTDVKVPVLFIHPSAHPWVDLILGTPTPKQLYCIRANESALPLASTVPYELDAAFREKAAEFIGKVCDRPGVAGEVPAGWAADTPPPLPAASQHT
jgi:hypothetical protein